MSLKILHISDSHGKNIKLPDGEFDFLIESGDFSVHDVNNFTVDSQFNRHVNKEVESKYQKDWFLKKRIPYYKKVNAKHKIVLAGNHDFFAYDDFIDGITLCKTTQTLEFDGLKIGVLAGSNIIDRGGIVGGWNDEIDEYEFRQRILLLDPDIDILISHQPPRNVLDKAFTIRLGSDEIYKSIFGLSLIEKSPRFSKLKAHLFGHIHEDASTVSYDIEGRNVVFSNASGKYNIIELKKD